jgi:ABC-type branched-subunit amino acid transport system substrate-binding protein
VAATGAGAVATGAVASAPVPLPPAKSGTGSHATPLRGDPAKAAKAPAAPSPIGESPLRNPWLVVPAALVLVVLVAGVAFGLRSRRAPAIEVAAEPAAPAAPAAGTAAAGPPTLTFGMASPLSGPDKELGRGMKIGVELAFAEANEAGGVHGKRLALLALDDGNDPAKTAEVSRDLIEKRKVLAVVGNAGTGAGASAAAVATEHQVPILGALGGAAVLPKDAPDRYVFAFRPGLAEETAAAVRYLVEVRRVEPGEIAFFLQEDEFGQAGWVGAVKALQALGRDPGTALRVGYKHNTADVSGAVDKLVRAGAGVKAVVMVATHRPAARLIEKLSAQSPGMLFTGASAVDAAALAEELVASKVKLAENVVVTQVVPLPSSRATAVIRYRSLLEKHALGEAPGPISLEGWVVGTLLVDALKKAGPDPDPEKLLAALESVRGLDIGIGVPLGFSSGDHQASHKVWGAVLQPGGAWKQTDLE